MNSGYGCAGANVLGGAFGHIAGPVCKVRIVIHGFKAKMINRCPNTLTSFSSMSNDATQLFVETYSLHLKINVVLGFGHKN